MKKIPAILPVAALAAALVAGAATRSPKGEIARNLDTFTSIYKVLQTSYVDSIDADKSMTTAINAMLNEIDPYTEYIPEKDRRMIRIPRLSVMRITISTVRVWENLKQSIITLTQPPEGSLSFFISPMG